MTARRAALAAARPVSAGAVLPAVFALLALLALLAVSALLGVPAAPAVPAAGAGAAASPAGPAQPAQPPGSAPLIRHTAGSIDGRYIVTLRPGTGIGVARRTLPDHAGLTVLRRFEHALNGFTAHLDARQVRALRQSPRVARVEQDSTVQAHGWNLDRLDQRDLPLDGRYHTGATGAGVTAYVIDTGIDDAHPGFEGRAALAHDVTGKGRGDCNGHGTHMAGVVGAAGHGVAPDVQLRAVRVLDCSGDARLSDMIAGLDWVAANAERPAVANVSVGGPYSESLNEAAAAVLESGVLVAAAAGNRGGRACTDSPAALPGALTVSASNRYDRVPHWSNDGRCLDVFAPGVAITSTWRGGGTRTIDGTSAATAHATGVAALYLQTHPSAEPAAVGRWIRQHATRGTLRGVTRTTPNRLLNATEL